jgi:GDPmannose 4,6-dehydratase
MITGITGQDGSYLAELLVKGYEVHGMVAALRPRSSRGEHLRDRLTLHQGDLLDERSPVDTLCAARLDEVYNFAATSFVAVSWIQQTLTAEFIGVGVTRLLEAIREVCPTRACTRPPRARCSATRARDAADRGGPYYPRSPSGVAKAYGHDITVNYHSPTGCRMLRNSVQR